MNFGGAASAFSQIPIDWLIIAVFFITVTVDAVRAGSVRACAFALSLPVSFFLFQLIPQTIVLGPLTAAFQSPIEKAVIFLILEVVLFVCVHQMLFSYDRYSSVFSAVVAGLSATVVVLVIWIQIPALQSLWHFDGQVQTIFGGSYSFLWLIASYLGLAFIGS